MINCFEVRIGLIAFLLAATVGTVLSIAYGYVLPSDVLTTEKIRQGCSDEMTKADQETKARGEDIPMLDSMIPLDSRIDFCVDGITAGLNAQGIEVLDK